MRALVVVPALNEERSVGQVVKEVLACAPTFGAEVVTVLVVDDGSVDATAAVARAEGAEVISNVFNLGVGGAMRVGFRYALQHGYDVVAQVDADGQHDPRALVELVDALEDDPIPQMVIGARFAGEGVFEVAAGRRVAMRILAGCLSRITGVRLTDVTSGLRLHNRAAIALFARAYPTDYLADTVESVVIIHRAGGRVAQRAVEMRPRASGSSSQSSWRAAVYLVRVMLILGMTLVRRPMLAP